MTNLDNSSGMAATKKASKNDLKNGEEMLSPIGIKGISMINVIIIEAKPPKKHLASRLKGSLFLSFLKMVYKKMITGVMDAMSRVMGLMF